MILKKTTLILGAGASCHLNYPLGIGLKNEILRNLWPSIIQIESGKTGDDLRRDQEFHLKLSRARYASPDAFLEFHEEFKERGRFLMALTLKSCEAPNQPFAPNDSGWYGHLADRLIHNISKPDDFRKNQLSVITYNYDRSLEYFLHETLKHHYGMPSDDAWNLLSETIRIVHVHGVLGEYPKVPYSAEVDHTLLQELGNRIKIVSEIDDRGDGTPEFQEAKRLLMEAEAVYMIGFAMADTNIKRLRFFKPETVNGRIVKCCLGAMGNIETDDFYQRIREYGLTSSHIHWGGSNHLFTSWIRLE